MLTRMRVVVLVLVGMTLAACGNIHPGDAAVVDGQSISMQTLNRTAKVYCALTLKTSQQQGATAPDNADLRRQAVTSLVSLVVARRLADEKAITINPATYEVTDAERQSIAKAFPKSDLGEVVKAIEDNQEISAIAVALGQGVVGQARTDENQQQLAEAGQAVIAKAFKDNDVEFAPRFGLDDSAKPTTATGSLSVSPTDLGADEPDDLPAAQRCS